MIKIRYADLPAGLHVRAEAQGRSTVIYLLPGLTPAERRAALLRVRRSASMGYGPHLSVPGVAAAVTLDRVGATLRNGATALRGHPLLLLPPVIIAVTATLVYIMLADVTISIQPPQASGLYPQPGAVPGTDQTAPPASSAAPGRPGGVARPPGGVRASTDRPSRSPHPGRSPGHSPHPSPSPSPSRSASPSASPSPSPSPSSLPSRPPESPSPQPSPTSTSILHAPPVSPFPSPAPSPSSSGMCLDLGPLGICVDL